MRTSWKYSYPEGKSIYSTYGDGILSSTEKTEMRLLVPCTHEEADTRLMVHVLDLVVQLTYGDKTSFVSQCFQAHQTGGGGSPTTNGHHSEKLYRKQRNLVTNLFDAELHVEDHASA